ncbi:MAG: ribosome silencing factor [Pikeienuella sp.]
MTGSDAVEPQKTDQDETGHNANDQIGGDKLLDFILDRLDQDKAEDVVTIDLAGKSSIADYMVVASGRSTRQVSAMTEKLTDDLKQKLGRTTRTEGKAAGDWVLVDAGDVIVHLFRPEVREFYQLEKMWMSTPGAGQATQGHS